MFRAKSQKREENSDCQMVSQFLYVLLFCRAAEQKIVICSDALCRESSVLQLDRGRNEGKKGGKRRNNEEKTHFEKVEWRTINLSKVENTSFSPPYLQVVLASYNFVFFLLDIFLSVEVGS